MAGPESTYQPAAIGTNQAWDDASQDLVGQAEQLYRELAKFTQAPLHEETARLRQWQLLTEALIVLTRLLAPEQRGDIADIGARLADLRTHLRESELTRRPHATSLIFQALRLNTMLLMTLASLGECRMETPYSRLRPVIKSDGTQVWCCNHKQEHCR